MTTQAPSPNDDEILHSLGYTQELDRRMGAFSNFAISLSMICILAGGLTSFHLGLSATGGASIGIGWPLACLFSVLVAASMAQLASAFPTAGGLYHWAAILGGRGWGWLTAWLNLAGLVTVLAAINVGFFSFAASAAERLLGLPWSSLSPTEQSLGQIIGVTITMASQGWINHRGIKWTTRLTDFSGYLILLVATTLTVSLVICAPNLDWTRLVTAANFSGKRGGEVWPETANLAYLFSLGLLLPAYTITGFDGSAHTSEETVAAHHNVPRGIVRSVLVSGVFGWIMLAAMVLALPSVEAGAKEGPNVFFWLLKSVLPFWLEGLILCGVLAAQYICGLATVTSASRMIYAFARDGGLPWSDRLSRVSHVFMTPALAIWTTVALATLFTVYTPVYSTITVVCVVLLYLSYVIPLALGFFAHGGHWQNFGPWTLGRWFKPACLVAVTGTLGLLWIGVQPPNDQAITILALLFASLGGVWWGLEKKRFKGPSELLAREEVEKSVGQMEAKSQPSPVMSRDFA